MMDHGRPRITIARQRIALLGLAVLLVLMAGCSVALPGQPAAAETPLVASGSVQDQLAQLAAGSAASATLAAPQPSATLVTPQINATALAEPSPTLTPKATRTRRPTATPRVAAQATQKPTSGPTARATRTPRPTPTPADGLSTVAYAKLPREAQQTIRLIQQGGPFPYDRDGVTFGNREGLLPKRPNGYYQEYTVITPGSADRGARRIVAGDGGELYYTDDHYETFKRVILP